MSGSSLMAPPDLPIRRSRSDAVRLRAWLLLALALLTTEAGAQQPSKVHQIGYLICWFPR